MMRHFLILTLLMGASATEAKPVPRKPASENLKMVATVTVGEKVTRFVVQSKEGQATIEMSSSVGEHRFHAMTQANFKYVIAEFQKLPAVTTPAAKCLSSKFEIVVEGLEAAPVRKFSCLDSSAPPQAKFANFATLLVLAD
jgi:hypothetical protein